jgi:hypothetical protein
MSHEITERRKYLRPDDFYLYEIVCSCGEVCGGWTPDEAEEKLKKHKEESK